MAKPQFFPISSAMRRMLRLVLLAGLVVATCYVLPRGERAAELHMAADDPAKLSDLRLDEVFNADYARAEIARTLDAGDVELAESFVSLANERGVPIPGDLKARLAEEQSPARQRARMAGSFGRGFATGQTDDAASLVGAAAGDLIGWGDVRDLARESWHAMTGQEVNKWLVGMSAVGLGITAWTYSSLGAAAPVREGLSVVKAATRTERLGKGLTESATKLFASGKGERVGVALADLGKVQGKAGMRAAIAGLRETESIGEIGKVAQLANARGRSTLAVLKTLGRSSFVLGAAAFTAFGWLVAAFVNLFLVVVAIQKGFIALVRKIWPRRSWKATQVCATSVA